MTEHETLEDEASLADETDPGTAVAEFSRSSAKHALLNVPVEVVVSVGRARPKIDALLDMKRDSLIALDSRMEDPVEIIVGDRVIARGELHELPEEGGRLGVRLTEIVDGGMSGR